MATWTESDDDQPVIYDGLGHDRLEGWEPRPSASARLAAFGFGVAAGLVLALWAAPIVARWVMS